MQWAANWGCEEEEVNTAAAKGHGGARDGKGGKEKGLQLGRRTGVHRIGRRRAGDGGQRAWRAKGVQRLRLGGTPPPSHAGGLPGLGSAGSAQAA